MFRDEKRCRVSAEVRQAGWQGLERLLPVSMLTEAVRTGGGRVGGSALDGVTLVWLAIAAARHQTRSFADVLALTTRVLDDAAHGPSEAARRAAARKTSGKAAAKKVARRSRHDPHGVDPARLSEEAFVQARARSPRALAAGAVIVAKQYNPTIKAFYNRLVDAGKPKMVALIASMRKLLTILNVMIRDRKTWNADQQHT